MKSQRYPALISFIIAIIAVVFLIPNLRDNFLGVWFMGWGIFLNSFIFTSFAMGIITNLQKSDSDGH